MRLTPVTTGGIDATKLHTGNILCEPHAKVRTTLKFRARILVFNIDVSSEPGYWSYIDVSLYSSGSKFIQCTDGRRPRGEWCLTLLF